ncbi:MAG: hypothetical protein K5776_07225 [Lachnospiraceae bacterium]|nr:hypothetical protein [Lachnospiraceae bacterium]
MVVFANVYGITIGLVLGICIALGITMKFIKKSNDIGDSKGEFNDFGDYVKTINQIDELTGMDTNKRGLLYTLFK